jgi:putative ABC transport system substrate-binding protein
LNWRTCRLLLTQVVLLITLVSIGGLAEAKTFVVGMVCQSATMEPAIAGFKEAFDALIKHDGDASVTYIHNGYVSDVAAEVERLISAEAVDLLLGVGTPATQAAQRATLGLGIPVVFTAVSDPVASGIVTDLIHPGGNTTGVKAGGSSGKVLEWLLKIAPETKRLYVPHWPADSASVQGMAELILAAAMLGVELVVREVATTEELLAALAEIPNDVDSLFLNSSGSLNAQIDAYAQAALTRRIPLVTMSPLVNRGALLTYGHDYRRDGEQAARLVHLIFHGAAPGEIPVEAADFFLGINLRTAAAIGLVISDDVLDQADFIVR